MDDIWIINVYIYIIAYIGIYIYTRNIHKHSTDTVDTVVILSSSGLRIAKYQP